MPSLITYSHFSKAESLIRIDELVKAAVDCGDGYASLTDIGNMYGVIEFYKLCKANNIKPIIGQEFFYVEDCKEKDKYPYRLVVLAGDYEAYEALMLLSTTSYLDGFYRRPRIDLRMLEAVSLAASNLFILPIDFITRSLQTPERFHDIYEPIYDIFGKNVYLPIFANAEFPSAATNFVVSKIKDGSLNKENVILANQTRYINKPDHRLLDLLFSIDASFSGRRKRELRIDDYNFKSNKEIVGSSTIEFAQDLMDNSVNLAAKCNLEIPLKFRFPSYENKTEEEAHALIKQLAEFNLLMNEDIKNQSVYLDRLKMELEVVKKLGFSNYFMVVSDIVRGAKALEVESGPGRGSVAGSVLAWCLGIHDVDPVKNGLYFERFLNPDRVSMPDIDMDFDDANRGKVIDYVVSKYSTNNVAQICTFSTLAIRGAFKDVGKGLGIDFNIVNELSQLFPQKPHELEIFLKSVEIEALLQKNKVFKSIYGDAKRLSGQFRQPSVHAAAVVISPETITKFTPLQIIKGRVCTQYDMHALEYVGLLKMDLLGLRTLSVIKNAISAISVESWAKESELRKEISKMDNKDTFELIREGDTIGVFQIEDGGMKNLAKRINVSKFSDVADLVALFRPALLQSGLQEKYISNKNGITNYVIHERLRETLKETYGIPLYQENLMKAAQELAGFTMTEADTLRKAVGKKDPKLFKKVFDKFIKGCQQKGMSKKEAEDVWKVGFEGSLSYGFNKAHAVSYGYISYITAYLKKHHQGQFFAALLTSVQVESKKEDFVKYIRDTMNHGISVRLPNINESGMKCVYNKSSVLLSFPSIKNIGEGFAEKIIEERTNNGLYIDVIDFCKRTQPDKTQLYYLLFARAFPDYNLYIRDVENIIKFSKALVSDNKIGFDILVEDPKYSPKLTEPFSPTELNGFLFDAIGYIVDKQFEFGEIYHAIDNIKQIKTHMTKKGEMMLFVELEMYPGYKFLMFPKYYKMYYKMVETGKKLRVSFKKLDDSSLSVVHVKEAF